MDEIDLKGLLGDLGKTKIDSSVLDTLKEANKVLGEGSKTIDLLKKTGLLPLIIRGIGKKLDVDPETPLKSENTVTPRSEEHKILFNEFNKLDTNQLSELVAQIYTQKSPSQEKAKK